MDVWMIWIIAGAVMALLEFILPGGIIVFLGMAAIAVGGAVYLGWITTAVHALLAWFIISILFMLFLRQLFIKYFEGDTSVENVDEDKDLIGSLVETVEEILPHKEGRVKFRDTTWAARSNGELKPGSKAVVSERDGNTLIVKPI